MLSLPAIAESFESIRLTMGRVHQRQPGEVLSPDREPMEVLEQLRLQLGSDLFSAQYQQAPVPPGGAMIKRHWIRRYTEVPPASAGSFVLQSCQPLGRRVAGHRKPLGHPVVASS